MKESKFIIITGTDLMKGEKELTEKQKEVKKEEEKMVASFFKKIKKGGK